MPPDKIATRRAILQAPASDKIPTAVMDRLYEFDEDEAHFYLVVELVKVCGLVKRSFVAITLSTVS
jgi:hypothetical protein